MYLSNGNNYSHRTVIQKTHTRIMSNQLPKLQLSTNTSTNRLSAHNIHSKQSQHFMHKSVYS